METGPGRSSLGLRGRGPAEDGGGSGTGSPRGRRRGPNLLPAARAALSGALRGEGALTTGGRGRSPGLNF